MNYRNSAAAHCHAGRLPKITDVGDLCEKLCVVISYHVGSGNAFLVFRGFIGTALLHASEIARAGWSELLFGTLLVADFKQVGDGKVRATNPRAATDADFEE